MARKNSKSRVRGDDDPTGQVLAGTDDPLNEPADDPAEAKPADSDAALFPRNKELATNNTLVQQALTELYDDVELGFTDQIERTNDNLDHWDLYNCELGPNQAYNGNSQVFVPIIKNAVNSRKTRFANQLFPPSQRYIETISSDASPTYLVSLLEHYVRRAKLRTKVTPALLKSGDVEGQYTVYVSWQERTRRVAYRKKVPTADEETGDATGEEHDDIVEETITTGCPLVEVIPDADVLVLPATSASVYEALDNGGSATIIRRWSKAKIAKMKRAGDLDKEVADRLMGEFDSVRAGLKRGESHEKAPDAAGIHVEEGLLHAVVYETWTQLSVGNHRLLCRVYFGGGDLILSARRNPYWSDRCPIFTTAVEKVEGCIKGVSQVKPCGSMQYAANDACNEAMDSAAYALLPIILTDPAKNPRIGSMVLNMAAIWEVDPASTQFAKFPDIWKSGFEIIAAHKNEIFQTLSASPANMPSMSQTHSRLNQAEIANEQQVDLLTTADSVTILEDEIFTPMINFFAELDHQFRSKEITVRQYGQFGLSANMESVPVIQFDTRYEFRWFGVEQSRNAQAIQQQIATMNVLRGIPPEQYPGYELNLVPIILQLVENNFGARLSPQIFRSLKDKFAVPVETEDKLLAQGIDMAVHPIDDDGQHLQAHQKAMEALGGDPYGAFRAHILKHVQQQALKAQQAAAQQMGPQPGQGMPGVPGGQQPGSNGAPAPGVAGTPRAGAQPMMPRGGQNPPGSIHPDQLRDANAAPRR